MRNLTFNNLILMTPVTIQYGQHLLFKYIKKTDFGRFNIILKVNGYPLKMDDSRRPKIYQWTLHSRKIATIMEELEIWKKIDITELYRS